MNLKDAEQEVDRQVCRVLADERITADCVALRLFGNGYSPAELDFAQRQLERLLLSGVVDREQGPLFWLWFRRSGS